MGNIRIKLSDVCPDCSTSLRATSGPIWCETCWRIVPFTVLGPRGALMTTGRWMRLPPQLQGCSGFVASLLRRPVRDGQRIEGSEA